MTIAVNSSRKRRENLGTKDIEQIRLIDSCGVLPDRSKCCKDESMMWCFLSPVHYPKLYDNRETQPELRNWKVIITRIVGYGA
jgi:hypothetical protein